MTKDRDQERREIVGRLKDEDQRARTELAKATSDYEKAQAKKLKVEAALLRAQSLPDDPEICVPCWITDGVHRKMVPQSSGYGADVFRCSDCGNTKERRA